MSVGQDPHHPAARPPATCLHCRPAGTQAAERLSGLPGRRWARCSSMSSWGTGGLVHSFIHSLSQQTLVGAPPGAHTISIFLRVLGCHPHFTAHEVGPQRAHIVVMQPPMRPARWEAAHEGTYLQPCPGRMGTQEGAK